ncbi:MAG TPA: HD-GYP domain-containing protein [Gemmataceae bacterium]|nr:HD-GYP domain-containing protein [Gemmataceae bacterium]
MATPQVRRFSVTDQAAALAIVMKKEFGVSFVFYDADTGIRVRHKDQDSCIVLKKELEPEAIKQLAQNGIAEVNLLDNGRFLLIMILHHYGKPVLVAAGEILHLTRNIAEIAQEQNRMQKWVQAFSDRLRQADQFLARHREDHSSDSQVKVAWETILRLDHVIRRLRLHKDPGKNQKRILQASFEMLGVQTLVWVPQPANEPVRIQGEALLSAWDFRQLASRLSQAPDLQASGLYICNEVDKSSWGGRFPQVRNILALPVSDQGLLGWVLAINKREPTKHPVAAELGQTPKSPWPQSPPAGELATPLLPFRRSDAALLTSFVALLDLQVRSYGRYRELQDLLVGLARSLTSAIDAKDSYTFGHSERVARIAMELGRELGLQEEELSDVFLAGLLHDIGKIGIRDAVLSKTEPLTPEDFDHIKQHVTIGYSILQNLRPILHLLPGVRNHHERFDGKGYPDGLAGDAIPLLARILSVADSCDAMMTDRPYRSKIPVAEVEKILQQGSGTQWDKRVIDAFFACRQKIHGVRQRGVGDSLRHALDDALRTNDSTLGQNLVAAMRS